MPFLRSNLKNVEIWKHDYSFDRKGIQDTKNKKTYLHEINENLNKNGLQ